MNRLKPDLNGPEVWKGDLPVTNRYSLGVAGEKFFRNLKENGTALSTYCEHCDMTYVPAVTFCMKCFTELDNYNSLAIEGELSTYTILNKDLDGKSLDIPIIVGFIKMGNGGLIHKISKVPIESLKIGMKLKACLVDNNKRIGSIDDIKYFSKT